MSPIGVTALALVCAQLVATACVQRRRHGFALADQLGLLPGWTFFVQPSDHDVAVEVRWHRPDGTAGPWREAWRPARKRRWAWLWAPGAHADSILWLAVDTLDRRGSAGSTMDADGSLAFATLLAFARGQPRERAARAVAFALVRIRDGARERRFASGPQPC